jgi:DNA-binding transcriptional LysR family regulator
MDTELLKTFLEVNRTRHFGHAAENLYISQSAVSARIRLLEDIVGVPLFSRTRNDIQPTPAGQKLVRHAERILNSWNRARQDIALTEDARVSLAVAGVPSLWDIALQDWLHWVHRELTHIGVTAEAQSQELSLRQLMDGTLDLAFLFESPQMAQLLVSEVFRVPLVMVSTRPNLEPQEAISEDYVLVDWGTSFGIAHARHFPEMPPPAVRIGLGRIARSFLLECGGTAYLAKPMIDQELSENRLFLVQDAPEIDRLAYAVYPLASDKREVVERTLSYFLPTSGKQPAEARAPEESATHNKHDSPETTASGFSPPSGPV